MTPFGSEAAWGQHSTLNDTNGWREVSGAEIYTFLAVNWYSARAERLL